jgi:hypothetical protein
LRAVLAVKGSVLLVGTENVAALSDQAKQASKDAAELTQEGCATLSGPNLFFDTPAA